MVLWTPITIVDWTVAWEKNKGKCTGPSYQNESSDSVSRKLLDEFENAFNTK